MNAPEEKDAANATIGPILEIIRLAINENDERLEIILELDGTPYALVGTQEKMVSLSTPAVVLLKPESGPFNQIFADDSAARFELYARALLFEGTEFITLLHRSWTLPALYWKKKD